MKYHCYAGYAGSQAQLGNPESEALASRDRKLELPKPNSQAGAWELAKSNCPSAC